MNIPRNQHLLVLSALLLHPFWASTAQAGIHVSLAETSTSTQLDFVVTGTLETSDFGAGFLTDAYPALFIFKSGLDWAGSSLLLSPLNYSDGLGLTAPSIELATGANIFQEVNGTGINQYLVAVNWVPALTSDFNIGEVIDWQFSVRNYGLMSINFDLLTVSEIPFSAQLGTGVAVPEPSTYALLFGILGLGAALIRRRKAA